MIIGNENGDDDDHQLLMVMIINIDHNITFMIINY